MRATIRPVTAWILGVAGLAAYNWWLLVPLRPGLMTSPNELFSNLEVSGHPYASLMQHCDVASGVLLLAMLLVLRPGYGRAGLREWVSMLVFAAAGAAGGLFPEVCADGIDASCRRMEYSLRLPASEYVHDVAGIAEFAAITIALLLAVRRTRGSHARTALVYRFLAAAAVPGYLFLGAAYLTDTLGGVAEAIFFAGFTVMVATQIVERVRAIRQAPAGMSRQRQLAGS